MKMREGTSFAIAHREVIDNTSVSEALAGGDVSRRIRPNEHSETLFEEILEECRLGRVSGPRPLSQILLQDTSSCASRAFPVVQSGKVRRADDWMRSHHSTVWVCDTPAYASADTLASCIQCAKRPETTLLSAVDHEGAYRSLPVREPSECGVVLPVAPDRALFYHNSLPFGSSGSVWSYLRVADVLSFLAVSLLVVPSAHFVDDFYQSEDEEVAPSGVLWTLVKECGPARDQNASVTVEAAVPKTTLKEKELRAKEEAEAATVVQRKDRAATPPWEKGKTSIESTAFKATDREKAEWAAIGKQRETALEKKDDKKEVKEDRWDALGRGRLTGNSVPTPTAEKAPTPKPQTPSGSENWRFGGSGAPATPSAGTARPDTSTPAAKPSGPPRFFNSKLQQQKEQKEQKEREEKAAAEAKAASSWRDRDSEASRSTNWRDRPAPKEAAPNREPQAEREKPAVLQIPTPPAPPQSQQPQQPQQPLQPQQPQQPHPCPHQQQPLQQQPPPAMAGQPQYGARYGGGMQQFHGSPQAMMPMNSGWMSQMSPQQQQMMMQQQMMQQQMAQQQQSGAGCGGCGCCGSCQGCQGCGYGCGGSQHAPRRPPFLERGGGPVWRRSRQWVERWRCLGWQKGCSRPWGQQGPRQEQWQCRRRQGPWQRPRPRSRR
eukprot:s1684_g16.t1